MSLDVYDRRPRKSASRIWEAEIWLKIVEVGSNEKECNIASGCASEESATWNGKFANIRPWEGTTRQSDPLQASKHCKCIGIQAPTAVNISISQGYLRWC